MYRYYYSTAVYMILEGPKEDTGKLFNTKTARKWHIDGTFEPQCMESESKI
jgi:hypothetical protein